MKTLLMHVWQYLMRVSDLKAKILVLLVAIFVSSCAVLKNSSWHVSALPEYSIQFEMPEKPRHFTMKTQGYKGKEKYQEWIFNDTQNGSQYIVVVKDIDKKAQKNRSDSWLLDNLDPPRIGFLDDARQLNSSKKYEGSRQYIEKKLVLSNAKKSVTHKLIINKKLVMMIFVYYDDAELENSGLRFLGSIKEI